MHRAAEGERGGDGEVHRLPVQHRQRARHAEAHRTHVMIGRLAEPGRAPAENLRGGPELGVDLETDDGLEIHT